MGGIISGCTDPYAENYNADANIDDGSCSGYPDNGNFALSFDGMDDYVDFGYPLLQEISSSGSFSVSLDIKNPEELAGGRLVSYISQNPDNSFSLVLTSSQGGEGVSFELCKISGTSNNSCSTISGVLDDPSQLTRITRPMIGRNETIF